MAPIKDTLIKSLDDMQFLNLLKININRIIPYPPSFSRIAAKTIDPAIGASTCALGSQRCTLNIGNFTNNPAIRINHINSLLQIEFRVQR